MCKSKHINTVDPRINWRETAENIVLVGDKFVQRDDFKGYVSPS